ncbi:hypothetical protein KCU87_g111, partial [Aureobasidium melanogenum]
LKGPWVEDHSRCECMDNVQTRTSVKGLLSLFLPSKMSLESIGHRLACGISLTNNSICKVSIISPTTFASQHNRVVGCDMKGNIPVIVFSTRKVMHTGGRQAHMQIMLRGIIFSKPGLAGSPNYDSFSGGCGPSLREE